MLAASATTTNSSLENKITATTAVTPIKRERNDSTTSESSLEHLDLGRTPKKLQSLTSATSTSTPHIANGIDGSTSSSSNSNSSSHKSNNNNNNNNKTAITAAVVAAGAVGELPINIAIATTQDTADACTKPPVSSRLQLRLQDSDEANDYDEDESADEKHVSIILARPQRHHKRRRLDKRASVQLEYNPDNPNSLRKKFRFNRSSSDVAAASATSLTNNESGFVDASCSSQYLNASVAGSTTATTQQSQASLHTSSSASASHSSSSASSSPHGAGAGVSSPESGIGEREDMKFVCPICEVVSGTPHEFTNHIRCHNYASGDTEHFTCAICSKVLSSASSLDRHVLVHTGERPFNCKYCQLTFTTNGNMHRHMRTHKQHQHNHRRNSNGTKNNNSSNSAANNNSNSNNNNSVNNISLVGTTTPTATQTTPVTIASSTTTAATATTAATTTTTYAQLTNGGINERGVKTASTTTLSTPATAAVAAGANGKLLNGSGVESYESDGGCSTDSSSSNISQSSNNHNNNNNNINNNNKNNNNNMKANNNNNNNNNSSSTSNNKNNIKNHVSNVKCENSDHLDDDIALMKRRVKTTINNNTIDASDENHQQKSHQHISSADAAPSGIDEQRAPLYCPVCSAVDFPNMTALSVHIDTEHSEIPAKCRNCSSIFRSYRQLNVHPCTKKTNAKINIKDLLPNADYSCLIARPLPNQRFDCAKCFRTFLCSSDLEIHAQECNDELSHLDRMKRRSLSESSAGGEEVDEDQQRREEFFMYLKNKELHAHNMNSMSSPQNSGDENLETIKLENDNEKLSHNISQQSHDSKDLADIQSILNMTSSSSTSNFFKNFEQSVNTPSSNYSLDKDEEEAQDVFTSEFRKMKLRGEFPCKLCTAVFPNLRALKGHNRIHLSAAGPAGPFRCNMCPYSICDKAALVRHMRTHNGDRPYECSACNYAFTTKANCERHLRNRHAKTTRDEVKRSIIYHPSEDSSCDDPTKKMHMFLSPDFDDDSEYQYQHQQPKDRSTPVSHLKEMLTSDSPTTKPMIQVKSLEQLRDKSTSSATSYNDTYNDQQAQIQQTPDTKPIDLSMDVLDLSKKPAIKEKVERREKEIEIKRRPETPPAPAFVPESISMPLGGPSANDEKNHQLLLAQQQLMNETIPKLDTAHYLQQIYRNLVFPPLNPFLFQSPFLANNLNDLQKFAPLMSRMFGAAAPGPPPQISNIDMKKGSGQNISSSPAPPMLPQVNPLMSGKSSPHSFSSTSPASINQLLPKSLTSPAPSNASLNIPRHSQIPPTILPGGPVKMVLKNGVFMPKQKQRRYRTERPFACEHCSARFTLRSNMERHIKQQHPEFYAHRQRSGHHIMRGRGASSAAAMNNITHLQAAFAQAHNNGSNGGHMSSAPISDQVKYAILAQQLKARKDTDLLQQALAHGSSSVSSNHMLLSAAGAGLPPLSNGHQLNLPHHLSSASTSGGLVEDDEPKLIIDEDDDYDDLEEVHDDNEDEPQENELNDGISETQLPMLADEVKAQTSDSNEAAKKVAKTILEEAIKESTQKSCSTIVKPEAPGPPANSMKSMIAHAESVGKFLKEVASSPFKDESQDLVSVSKLVDNATSNSVSFNNYFRPSDVANNMEQSDEEGLVASGSASESNNSGTEDIVTSAEPKKKSAYSLAPNRVSCPYCQRMFPWSSSLRRHILTHTGQKPFKCSHCPLLFTTKSNCDRHLMRKHGNVESAVSVYVPTEDVSEPIPVPKSVEEIEQQQRKREEEERRRKAEEAQLERERREKEQRQQHEQEQQQHLLSQLATAQINQLNAVTAAVVNNQNRAEINAVSSSDLPFKCHLCENSFGERIQCLEHIKIQHSRDFALLLAKGAIDTDVESSQHLHHNDDIEERRAAAVGDDNNSERVRNGGRYPDYSNRKVICAFCMRRFWSTEDLRRHMRTHSGERPYQCEVCMRKFTLKHSMLRHMKKHDDTQHHNGGNTAGDLSIAGNSGSDFSDDEQTTIAPMPTATTSANSNVSNALRAPKIQELLNKTNEWRTSRLSAASTLGEQKENIADEPNNQNDLIGNLLGISDQGILNKLLSSADEAAKFLGVEK